jgi:hypothetical protein
MWRECMGWVDNGSWGGGSGDPKNKGRRGFDPPKPNIERTYSRLAGGWKRPVEVMVGTHGVRVP